MMDYAPNTKQLIQFEYFGNFNRRGIGGCSLQGIIPRERGDDVHDKPFVYIVFHNFDVIGNNMSIMNESRSKIKCDVNPKKSQNEDFEPFPGPPGKNFIRRKTKQKWNFKTII